MNDSGKAIFRAGSNWPCRIQTFAPGPSFNHSDFDFHRSRTLQTRMEIKVNK
jgi:hypothetical protein